MYEDKKKTLMMAGEEMDLLFDVDCLWTSAKRTRIELPTIVSQLCTMLSSDSVAYQLINNVKIGEKVILIDKEANRTYRMKVQANTIYVLDIYEKTMVDSEALCVIYMPTGRILQAIPRRVEAE